MHTFIICLPLPSIPCLVSKQSDDTILERKWNKDYFPIRVYEYVLLRSDGTFSRPGLPSFPVLGASNGVEVGRPGKYVAISERTSKEMLMNAEASSLHDSFAARGRSYCT